MTARRISARRLPTASAAPQPAAPSAPTPGSPLWAHPALGSALAAFLLYLPSLGGAFLRDDHSLIEKHPYLRTEGWLLKLLFGDFWAPVAGATGMWRPAVVFSYWVDGRLGGWAPQWFHVVNNLAHGLASGAVALLVLAWGGSRATAWLAGLAFAAMPAHAECVAWISGRTDVFCALFGVAALWVDQRARADGRPWLRYAGAVSLGLALLSKEAGVPLFGVLVIMEWTRRRSSSHSLLASARWIAPYILVTVGYLVLHSHFAPDPGRITAHDLHGRAAERGAGWALFPGYFVFLWPWFLHSPDRAAPMLAATPAGEIRIGVVCAIAVTLLFAGTLWKRARVAPALALALFPMVPPLVLASTRGYGLFGERHMYVPSAGVVWALAVALPPLAARWGRLGSRLTAGLCSVLVLGSAVETLRALPAYRSDEAMFRTMTVREPDNPVGFIGLSQVLTESGRLDEAAPLLERATALDPTMAAVWTGRARVAERRQQWPTVLAEADRALSIDPTLWEASVLRDQALLRLGRADEAMQDLARLHRQYPGEPQVGVALAQAHMERGRPLEALEVLQRSVAFSPTEAALWNAMGVANSQAGRWEDARAAFRRTVSLAPRSLLGWLRLAAACQRLGDGPGRDEALARARVLPGGDKAVADFARRLGGAAP